VLAHECRVDRAGDRTLVEVVVENETTVDRRVRVENRLDGRVEPPRENGVPLPGWDDDGYAGVVPADDRLTLGYACAAPPVDPPVAVRDEGRPTGDDEEAAAADAARLLGDHAPPADAVPVDDTDAPASDDARAADTPPSDDPPAPVAAMVDRLDDGSAANGDAENAAVGAEDPASPDESAAASPDEEVDAPDAGPADDLPPAVASWLAAVRGRVVDAEDLAAGDLAAAARVVDERGGATAAAALADDLAADERALRAVARVADDLADRADDAAVPVDALRRLS
jgi:hypothetical protein